jgi:hypothetical protein
MVPKIRIVVFGSTIGSKDCFISIGVAKSIKKGKYSKFIPAGGSNRYRIFFRLKIYFQKESPVEN